MANCGWLWPLSGSAVMLAQVSSSRSVSSPGRTTAPCGRPAMVASRVAVAGMEPVEPAAITGAALLASRAASAAISLSRRSAGSRWPFSSRMAGHCVRMNLRKLSVIAQYLSYSSGTRSSSRSQLTWRVVMSSINRASSCASASAVAGLLATSGASPPGGGAIACAQRMIKAASGMMRSRPLKDGGKASASAASAPAAASAKAISSSSMSPSGTMRGRMAALPGNASRKALRARRQARRVGR